MSGLLSSLSSSGNALAVYQSALTVIQNNVDNASTPGFARQSISLSALPLDIAGGAAGGVASRGVESSRDEYAEAEVRRQLESSGQFSAQSQGTNAVQSLFDVTGNSGLSASLNQMFQAFSAWSVSPADTSTRQSVFGSAGVVADSIRGLATSLSSLSTQLDGQISSTTGQINQLTQQIQSYNVRRLRDPGPDPAADAQLHSSLESLAQLVDTTTFTQGDGTVTVLTGSGSPLVIGDQRYSLSARVAVPTSPAPVNPQAPPSAQVLDGQGDDITNQIRSGQLGGLLNVRNSLIGSILGDAQQTGSLNKLASSLSDTINSVLQSGAVSSAPGATSGAALFSYNGSDPTLAASTFAVNPGLTADQLAPADTAGNSNGNALQLAALVKTPQAKLNGASFSQYYGQIAAAAGQAHQTAAANDGTQQQITAQARAIRDGISGVSLDQEALQLTQFQRSYQSTAKVLSVLSDLISTTINMIP